MFTRSPLDWLACAALVGLAGPVVGQRRPLAGDSRAVSAAFVFEGFVLAPDGTPAEGAVVVSSAGGQAIADRRGRYRLEARVPLGSKSVQIQAAGGSVVASTRVDLARASGFALVEPLQLAFAGCQPEWLPTFGDPPGLGSFTALAVLDDGGGSALYAGRQNSGLSSVGRWDGSRWSMLPEALDSAVLALAVFEDGSGPALYAGGDFQHVGSLVANGIAKWDGTSWSAVGSGVSGPAAGVHALAVFDDGGGPALYAGGRFQSAGGVVTQGIARWDGASWSPLGSGIAGWVNDLAVYDDGDGPALHAGGAFVSAGGVAANRIARWDGSSWSALAGGLGAEVLALTVFDDGSGSALHVGGRFTTAAGIGASHVAKWDGASWSALGGGTNGDVLDLVVFDGGGGAALHACGAFTTAGAAAANHIAEWNGSSWAALAGGTTTNGSVLALAAYDDGTGPGLHASGSFWFDGSFNTAIAKWDGASWSMLERGLSAGVETLTVFDDGTGPALYAGGSFLVADRASAPRIARWNGSSWSPLDSGVSGPESSVSALSTYDDGGGPALYAGGSFTTAGGVAANRIAKWNGSSWAALGLGTNASVRALTVFDDGGGSQLCAGGDFTSAGASAANRIASWNGASWAPLGSGMDESVRALAVFDDGSGPALHAGGSFTTADGLPAQCIARWDGASWSALGSGLGHIHISVSPAVEALAVHDDGSGPALHVGGLFTRAGQVLANNVAKWDGSSWSALGGGVDFVVHALAVFDDGSGPALYAGGAGGATASHIARWDGASWTELDLGLSDTARALAVFDDGYGPALYAGGDFLRAGPTSDAFLARWRCPLATLDHRRRAR